MNEDEDTSLAGCIGKAIGILLLIVVSWILVAGLFWVLVHVTKGVLNGLR